MEIQRQILLFFSGLHNGFLNSLGQAITMFGENFLLIAISVFIYWNIRKRDGFVIVMSLLNSLTVMGVAKAIVRFPRPWLVIDNLETVRQNTATGYSFPSGHTMCAAATYGSVAAWQYRRRNLLVAGCIVMILLTGFSRNFLGVHTPQDVLVGIAETVLIIIAAGFIQKKVSGNSSLADKLTVCGIAAAIGALLYVQLKSYPMDYVDGALLVDPENMKKDIFGGVGGLIGLLAGSWIERHYVKYRIPKGSEVLPVMACAGVAAVYIWEEFLKSITFRVWFGMNWGSLVSSLLLMILAVGVYPIVIMKAAERAEQRRLVAVEA